MSIKMFISKAINKIEKIILPEKIYSSIYIKKKNKNKKKKLYVVEREIDENYKIMFGEKINWDNPKSYTEKLNVSKLYNSTSLKEQLADKVLVRDWIKDKIGDKYLIPLIKTYNNFEEINFKDLPNQFVMKCNHDSGSTFICNDKKQINIKELKNKYDYFLKRNLAYSNYEMHYKNIIPKIMIEKNMGKNINDYKFLCFNGKPYYCWVDVDRFKNHKRNIYDMEWNLQPFNQANYGNFKFDLEKPSTFGKMKEIVKILSKGFDHVRVDLYEVNNQIFFGEMTFTNGNGTEPIMPREYDYKLGKLWDFNNNNRLNKLKKFKVLDEI